MLFPTSHLLCLDATPTFLGAFDFSVAPALLFYAYIPIMAVVLFISNFIIRRDKDAIQHKLLMMLALAFSFWIINIIVQWTAVEASVVYFAWQVTPLLEIFIPLTTVYFTYTFIEKRDVTLWMKGLFVLIVAFVAFFTPTHFNTLGFDIYNCEALVSHLPYYVYGFELFAVLWIVLIGGRRYLVLRHSADKAVRDNKIFVTLATLGSTVFILLFAISNLFGELTKTYEINLIGPLGMLIFLGVLMYMMVRFKAFNVKVLSAQALVWALIFFIGAQFFFIHNPINYFLNGFTFAVTLVFGKYLVNSVRREVEQREYLATLNWELKDLNKQRENLVHLITHKVKGSFTRTKYIFAEMIDGSFGKIDGMMMKMARRGLESDAEGIHTVDLVLNAFNLGSGAVKYDMKPIELKKIAQEVMSEKGARIKEKGLVIVLDAPDPEYNLIGDAFWLKEVMNNFIENSLRYSMHGTIQIKFDKKPKSILLSIKDEGAGLSEDDKKSLFTEGGRGKDSLRMNVDSTGYGLFSVKVIVDAHKGRVWAESPGRDKGSTFYVDLPLDQ
ncbi:MAG: sensor histidine kinase [Candidatus Paceibacterota bacterium]